jgi:hypothetical protein
MRRAVGIAVLVVFSLSSCVTATNVTFDTAPDGADVYVDGSRIGESPTSERISNAIWSDPRVRIEKEGYETINSELHKELKGVNLAIGLLLWWPALLWVHGPVETQFFRLEPTAETAAAAAEGDAARAAEDLDTTDDETASERAQDRDAEESREETGGRIVRQTIRATERALARGDEVRLGVVVRTGESGSAAGGMSEDAIIARLLERFGRNESFSIVDRSETEEIAKEFEFQMSGMVDEEQLSEYGRLSGATHLLVVESVRDEQGSVLILEDNRRLLHVESGTALAADATVTTMIWNADRGEYEVVSRTYNGRPIRLEDGRMYPAE